MAKDKQPKKGEPGEEPGKSAAVKTVDQRSRKNRNRRAAAATNTAVNLCDECAYEFGACEGIPKFASEADPTLKGTEADRVVECKGFRQRPIHADRRRNRTRREKLARR